MSKGNGRNSTSIDLPELILGPIRYSIGEAHLVLQPSRTVEIVAEDTVRISARLSERRVRLSSRERIVVTARAKVKLPARTDGVLRVSSGGANRWLAHRQLINVKAKIKRYGLASIADKACATWQDKLRYTAEKSPLKSELDRGLRPPQLGALFAIGSHWSLSQAPATIVMPTGTGKTETMLSVLAAHQLKRLLVAVPSKALRSQTARKFQHFGLLRELNVLDPAVMNPVVGVVLHRPKTAADLALFRDCNVVVGIPSSLAGGTAGRYLSALSEIIDTLIVDEAHHVAARTWDRLKSAFLSKPVLQFTATPYRNDNKLVDGSVVYSYPLGAAQKDGYFTSINFEPVYEIDDTEADDAIAKAAIARLRSDRKSNYDHLLMARCKSVERATEVHNTYLRLAPEFHPILVHSDLIDADERITKLQNRSARIVVCVNMLGEGVDIPALKIAAVHDSHQSLAVLLQFIGRFTRTGGKRLGDASVVANIANPKISIALEQLYSQDADWNALLREMSSEAAQEHADFVHFLEQSTPFETGDDDWSAVSRQSLRPTFSTLFYRATAFRPKRFHEGLSDRYTVVKVWLNRETNTLYFVTRSSVSVKWTRSKKLQEVEWHLFVLHYDSTSKLLYLASTNKDSHFEDLAHAVGATQKLTGEMMFRSLGHIGRLVFNNLGVTKHGRRNLSFAMYTGTDVKQALSETEKLGSRKSNISGYGWEDGSQITIGCSYKGRVWSKAAGTIPKFIAWAENVGPKLIDETIDTKSVIANVLIPEFADALPNYKVLSLDWPVELISLAEDRVTLISGAQKFELVMLDLSFQGIDQNRKQMTFTIVTGDEMQSLAEFRLTVNGQAGFDVTETSGKILQIRKGSIEYDLAEFFNNYPPLVRFVDLSELDGNILLKAENSGVVEVPVDRLHPWDWSDVDITKESIWKGGIERRDSIQWRVAQHFIEDGFAVVFDDDGAGEAADLVCLNQEDNHIRLVLVHCKFSGAAEEGKRVKDVVEVASQAVRSARRPGKFNALIKHIEIRHSRRRTQANRTLFLAGSRMDVTQLARAARFKEVRSEIWIVQPGLSKTNLTEDQSIVLGAAVAYVKQTLGIDLDVICSA